MKLSELKKYIEENIVEILGEVDVDKTRGTVVVAKNTPPTELKKLTSQGVDVELKPMEEAKDEDEEVEDTYGKEDEDDKKDAKIANAEPSKSELKKIDKEFGSNKLAKKLSDDEKSKLDRLEAGIKKKLSNPTKDNIAVVKQLINKPEIKKLFNYESRFKTNNPRGIP
jgi:cobalamin biosynthesis protein CobT